MPAKSPRLNVTISDHQHAVLLEIGKLQGRSAASYLREMVDASMPMLEAMLPVFRAAAMQEAMRPEALQTAIRSALAGIEDRRDQLDLLEYLSRVHPELANDLEPVVRDAPSEARADERPARPRRKSA